MIGDLAIRKSRFGQGKGQFGSPAAVRLGIEP
jgi:hypothetical protein